MINDLFDKIYCINLDRRTDRWEQCVELFKKYNLTVERFSAFDGENLNLGYGKTYDCELAGTISHSMVINDIRKNGYNNALILEDDVEFSENFIEQCETSLKELPPNWDILFFGGNHTGGYEGYSSSLIRVFKTFALHCYAVNYQATEQIYENMLRFIGNTLCSNKKLEPSVAADFYMAKLHPHMNVFSVFPNIAWQRESYSDLQREIVDYKFLKNEK